MEPPSALYSFAAMTTAQIITALDEEIDRLQQVRHLIAHASTPKPLRTAPFEPKHRTAAKASRRSEGQKRRWAAARARSAPQIPVTRVRERRAPRRHGPRPRQRETTALTGSIPDGPVVFNRRGGAPLVHRPFAELEAMLKKAS